VSLLSSDLLAKRLEIVRQLTPATAPTAVLINPKSPEAEPQVKEVQDAARSISQQIKTFNASTLSDIDSAFSALAELRAGTLIIISADPYFFSQRERIPTLAIRHAIATISDRREFAAAGGVYAGKIVKGAKPADIPVEQVARFEFVINLKAAKPLDLTFPPTLLALADEVIE
jgi:putative ABC transport system substrate-binding protein